MRARQKAFAYFDAYPYVEPHTPLDKILGYERQYRPNIDKPRPRPKSAQELSAQQAHLDELSAAIQKAQKESVAEKYAFTPS